MAADNTKKSIRNASPVSAGFVRFFEMAERALKDVNDTYKNLDIPSPANQANTRREANRPYRRRVPDSTPWGGM